MNGGTQMNKDNSSWITRRKLPKRIADNIEDLSYNVPWYFKKDCALPLEIIEREGLPCNPYFSHALFISPNQYSDHYGQFPWEFIKQFAHIGNKKKMIRAHVTFHYPSPEKFGVPHNKHVDQQFPHDVILYYVNDADGDTFFFDSDGKVIHRETPERGKMVIFDGSVFHSSSSPSNNVRMTLNINYERT